MTAMKTKTKKQRKSDTRIVQPAPPPATRLTQRMRRGLVRAIVRKRLESDQAKCDASEHRLATRIYEKALGRKGVELADSLPSGWLGEHSSVSVQYGGRRYHFDLPMSRRFPEKFCHTTLIVDSSDDPLWQPIADHIALLSATEARKTELEEQAAAIIHTCSTTKALSAKWPETKPFIESVVGERQEMLPAVDLSKLNKDLLLE